MKTSKKLLALIMSTVLTFTLFTGCATSLPGEQASGSADAPAEENLFVVGLDENFQPMGFRDSETGEIVGFDIDLAVEAAKRAGYTAKFLPIDWDSKEMELNTKKIDCIWNGLTITPEREKAMSFSKPYMDNRQVVVIPEGSTISTFDDLAGKEVGVQKGSTAADSLKASKYAKSIKKIVEFADNVTAVKDLGVKRLDAVVVDSIFAQYSLPLIKDKNFIILPGEIANEQFGVGFRKDDTELLPKIQAALDEMFKDGTAEKISMKWFNSNVLTK